MTKALLATAVGITALIVSSPQPLIAQGDVDQQFGVVNF